MNTSFLDYYKMILEKVSFDKALFIKEYKKALRALPPAEIYKLNAWVKDQGFAKAKVLALRERNRQNMESV